MKNDLSAWAGLLSITLLILLIVLLTSGFGAALVVGLAVGMGFGSAFGAIAATAAYSEDKRRDRQMMERFIYEHSQPQTEVIYEAPPLLLEALDRLTSTAVLGGACCFCGSDHPGLETDPFNPNWHQANPRCAVPLARRLVLSYLGDPIVITAPAEPATPVTPSVIAESLPTKRFAPASPER